MDRLIVGLPYRGPVQRCLKNVKYKSSWNVIQTLTEIWMKKIDSRFEILGDTAVTAVPMWARKERARGFNQAERLAKMVAETWGMVYCDCLERTRETRPMWGLSRNAREDNIRGAFRGVRPRHSDTVSRILLVDDVWTTGATMRECARILKQNGAKEIWGVALAR